VGAPCELITSVAAQPSDPVPPVGQSLCVEPVLEGRASNHDDAIRHGAEVDFDPLLYMDVDGTVCDLGSSHWS
jgi:hypothetical protein